MKKELKVILKINKYYGVEGVYIRESPLAIEIRVTNTNNVKNLKVGDYIGCPTVFCEIIRE